MMMQFGHFLGHDITLSSQEELDCCHPNIIKQGFSTFYGLYFDLNLKEKLRIEF